MELECRVMILFRSGEDMQFEIPDIDHFQKLVDELTRVWGVWLYVGKSVVIRKKDITSIAFISKTKEKLDGQADS